MRTPIRAVFPAHPTGAKFYAQVVLMPFDLTMYAFLPFFGRSPVMDVKKQNYFLAR
ncbi:hypothetical protein [Nostoc sp. PA-18-2419]|uniref:hypothetical protein n=1 Tax=Nostoc sp. PA-18-2419 TaxID=2575443 RepID=UPI001CB8B3F3|nr:hypothetical protein [Nostoc sp. PA-18-2419]